MVRVANVSACNSMPYGWRTASCMRSPFPTIREYPKHGASGAIGVIDQDRLYKWACIAHAPHRGRVMGTPV